MTFIDFEIPTTVGSCNPNFLLNFLPHHSIDNPNELMLDEIWVDNESLVPEFI